MGGRLLLIEESQRPLEGFGALQVACRGLRYDRADWSTFLPEMLLRAEADLVVPVAVSEATKAIDLFRWLKTHPISIPTLAVLPAEPGPDLLSTALEVVDDFVFWPVREGEWRQRVVRLLDSRGPDEARAGERLVGEIGLAKLVGRNPAFLSTIAKIPLAAQSGSPVLITGETGTGKELFARAIHHLSRRRSFPFIPVDCGALPDHLLENELFGHARGAFTDAHADQRGLIAMADGGALFLDEVDALSLSAQAKLLRFLQERTFKPLGAERFVRVDVNVLTATNRDLEALVREQRFRSDLYFRLNVLCLHLEPLRARPDDIPLLARHFVESICGEQCLPRKALSPTAVRKLVVHEWPGNVRELFNVIQRAVVFSEGTSILPSHVLTPASAGEPEGERQGSTFRQGRARAVEAFERLYVHKLLRRHGGNITRAAREAQKDRRAFGRLVKKYSLSRLDA